jgi:nucleoid DNA-binding protein
MSKQNEKKEKRTITVKDLVKTVRGKVGWGLRQDFVEEIVRETIKEMFRQLLEGKRIKIAKGLALISKMENEYKEEVKNIGGVERIVKKVPYISIKTSPSKIKAKEGEGLKEIKERLLERIAMV